MVTESIARLCDFFANSIVLSSILIFSIRLCLRVSVFLIIYYWRRRRTFTFRQRCWRRTPAEDAQPPPYCAICLQEAVEGEKMRRLTECRHCFHEECVEAWLRMQSTCPLCRSEVPPPPRANLLLTLFVPFGVIDYINKNGAIVSDA